MNTPRTPQRWVVTCPKGHPVRTLFTKGGHPCFEPGEPATNVMRTHPVDDDFDSATMAFGRIEGGFAADPVKLAEIDHRAILIRFSQPLEIARALANGLSKADRAALKAAFKWQDAQAKDEQ